MEDIIGDISGALGIRIGRRQNLDFTSGNGTGQPRGILLDATIGTTLRAFLPSLMRMSILCSILLIQITGTSATERFVG